jgi:methyl-accepting chemotaxis protein
LKPEDQINKEHPKRLFILLLGVFILFTAASAVYLYLDIYKPLSTHYSAIVSIVSDIHETLIVKTLKINLLFFALIAAGILILGILYTHRICGPLKRIKIFAKAVSEGRLDTRVSFREKDAIHPFGDTFNDMMEAQSNTVKKLSAETKELKSAVRELKTLSDEGKDIGSGMERVSEIDKRIKEVLNKLQI